MLRSAQTGFTLLELMVVIAIIATITGMAIPSFNSYINNQNLRQAQDQIKSDIRGVQIRALNGVKQNLASPTYWGIAFQKEIGRYSYFVTDVAAPNLDALCTTVIGNMSGYERSETLPADIQIADDDICIFFSFEDGDAVCRRSSVVNLRYPSGGTTYNVAVNRVGTVYTYTGTNPIPVGERCPTN